MMVGLLLLHLLLGLKIQNAHGETSWTPHDCKEFSCEACERWCSWSAGLAGCPAQRQIMRCLKAVEPGTTTTRRTVSCICEAGATGAADQDLLVDQNVDDWALLAGGRGSGDQSFGVEAGSIDEQKWPTPVAPQINSGALPYDATSPDQGAAEDTGARTSKGSRVSFWAGALALGAGCFWLWRKRRSREAALEPDDQEQPVEQVV